MGRWKINGCPRCRGSMVIDKDEDGWYELCINCAYRNDLRVVAETAKNAAKKKIAVLAQVSED
jgi:hypothetical protein